MAPELVNAIGLAARDSSGVVSPLPFTRRAVGEHDVKVKVLYCGICYSDLSALKNLSGNQTYPAVPGHEITGVATEVGSKVERFKVGDKIAVSCMVGSCRKCEHCAVDAENLCSKAIFTYNSIDTDGTKTYGGYSDVMVVNEHFVISWPENFPQDVGAPLLCAGSTTYSAMKYYKLDKPGLHVGVFGLGGLGHVAVKYAKAFGMKVTVISSSIGKKTEAIERFGVDSFLLINDAEAMKSAAETLDGVIDTVPPSHSILPLLSLLKPHKNLVMLAGAGKEPVELPVFPMIVGRKTVSGSMISGVKETQEMIEFSAKHNILPEVEIISMDYVNKAIERLERSDVRYRFVIDIGSSTLKSE